MRWRLTNNDSRAKMLRGSYGAFTLASGETRDVVGEFDPAWLGKVGVTAVEAPPRRAMKLVGDRGPEIEPTRKPRRRHQ